jgi:hypothetical protein
MVLQNDFTTNGIRSAKRSRHLSLHLESATRKSGLTVDVLLACLSAQHIVDPSTIGLELDATVKHDGEVQPSCRVTDSADLIRDVLLGELAHLSVETFVGVQIVHVLGDGFVVSRVDEVPRLSVLDLERDTTGLGRDDRLAGVESFGDLDFEALAGGELEDDAAVGEESVEDWNRDVSL